jgi:hypothetical protein
MDSYLSVSLDMQFCEEAEMGISSVHYIKEIFLRELTTWLFFVPGFQRKKERKKERKWVFFGC